jgi:uncharacterized RDD family membrane protein YckC
MPPLATPGQRIGARLIDVVINLAIGFVVAAIVVSSDESAGVGGFGGDVSAGTRALLSILSIAIGFVYEAVITALKGGTPGKLLLGLRVVDADRGSPVTFAQAIVRWAIPGVFGLIPVLGALVVFVVFIVSFVFLFTDARRQTVSDKVAKTVVVRK